MSNLTQSTDAGYRSIPISHMCMKKDKYKEVVRRYSPVAGGDVGSLCFGIVSKRIDLRTRAKM